MQTSMLQAGLPTGEILLMPCASLNTGARKGRVERFEITRRGIYNVDQKYLKVMVHTSGTFETSLEDWDFTKTPPKRLVWCPCTFGSDAEYPSSRTTTAGGGSRLSSACRSAIFN